MKPIAVKNITRAMTAFALAASLALTPATAGPRRDNDDVAAFIAALIAMGFIGAVISSHSDEFYEYDRYGHRFRADRLLPARCLQTFETRQGDFDYFSARCLERNFDYYWRLPARCERTIRAFGHGDRTRRQEVYEPRCLRHEGYMVARIR